MRVSIYDLDGTIVNSLHRYRAIENCRIDLDYWRKNEYKAYSDTLLPLADQYKADIKDPECYTIIATARILKDPDNRFIKDKLGIPNYIISRKEGDNQSGATLKIKGLQKLFNLKQFKKADAVFYEDNKSYLNAVCNHFYNIKGVHVPSEQGH